MVLRLLSTLTTPGATAALSSVAKTAQPPNPTTNSDENAGDPPLTVVPRIPCQRTDRRLAGCRHSCATVALIHGAATPPAAWRARLEQPDGSAAARRTGDAGDDLFHGAGHLHGAVAEDNEVVGLTHHDGQVRHHHHADLRPDEASQMQSSSAIMPA